MIMTVNEKIANFFFDYREDRYNNPPLKA